MLNDNYIHSVYESKCSSLFIFSFLVMGGYFTFVFSFQSFHTRQSL